MYLFFTLINFPSLTCTVGHYNDPQVFVGMTINGAENSTGQSAVFKIHVNTKIIFLVVIYFTMTLNVVAHKAHLRENNTFLKTEP